MSYTKYINNGYCLPLKNAILKINRFYKIKIVCP